MLTMNKNNFKKRREHLLKQIGPSGIAILFSPEEQWRNKENYYTYRQDSDFYYLTGFKEPESIAVFAPGRTEGEFILFNRVRDPLQETWHGKREGQEGALKNYGADQAFAIDLANNLIPQMIAERKKIYFNIEKKIAPQIVNWVEQFKNKNCAGINAPAELISISSIVDDMRAYKDPEEIVLMKKSCAIISQAQRRAMQVCRPNMKEYEIEAEIIHECVKNGARFQAFDPVIAGGANTCILHYMQNEATLQNGGLVLMDIGAECELYASDLTRTIPINGRFSTEQRIIYEAVLDVQLNVLKHAKPGVRWIELQELAEKNVTEKLLKIGLLQGSLEELIANKAFFPFFMHKIGHWIGLDVHDVGWYKDGNGWRKLEPNMLMTVEPGIYISKNIPNIDPKWHDIGVRIEDMVLITENGCEILTAGVPKTVEEIEQLMAR